MSGVYAALTIVKYEPDVLQIIRFWVILEKLENTEKEKIGLEPHPTPMQSCHNVPELMSTSVRFQTSSGTSYHCEALQPGRNPYICVNVFISYK